MFDNPLYMINFNKVEPKICQGDYIYYRFQTKRVMVEVNSTESMCPSHTTFSKSNKIISLCFFAKEIE